MGVTGSLRNLHGGGELSAARKKKLAKFPLKDWQAHQSGFHLKPISPYYGKSLKMSAHWWWKHHLTTTLHGVASKDRAFPVSKSNRHSYTITRFAFGVLSCHFYDGKCEATVYWKKLKKSRR